MRCAYVIGLLPMTASFAIADGSAVYKQAIPAVVWVHSTRSNGLATGSGTLIDRERRLVLTNYHVVEDNPRATIFFPEFRDDKPIPEKQYYTDRAKRLGHVGRVIALDKQADLAIIRLDSVPMGVPFVPLAATSPEPGQDVHSIGNAGKSGALWGYVKGTVRQVYRKKWKAELGPGKVASFEAKVIETDSPTNPGDSGGPLLNDKGELVGVTQGGAVNAQLVSFFVDVSEVKHLLASRAVREIETEKPAEVVVKRAPPTVADDAKLFSADGMKAADATLAELFRRGLPVLVETHPTAPASWIEKAKQATPEDRQKMFREWALDRLKAEKADGIAILVCLDPRVIHVEFPEGIRSKFPEGQAKKVGDVLIAAFKTKKYDDGLAEALGLIRTSYTGGKK